MTGSLLALFYGSYVVFVFLQKRTEKKARAGPDKFVVYAGLCWALWSFMLGSLTNLVRWI